MGSVTASKRRSGVFSFLVSNDTAEVRDFFQARLASFAKLELTLSGGFWVASVILTAVVARCGFGVIMRDVALLAHLAATVSCALMWLALRRTKRSTAVLDFIDAVGTLSTCAFFSLMSLVEHTGHSPEYNVVLAVSWTLVARAAMVPSNAARTALVAAGCVTPAVVLAFLRPEGISAGPVQVPNALYILLWGVIATIATPAISRVIYGLEQRVREAMSIGQYTLVEKIGEGGMGVVYRANHALLRRPTAIKLLQPSKSSAVDLARFEREVQMTALLTHPNTVAVYDFGRTPEGLFYYAMEYLDGISLEDLVREDGPQPAARVAHFLKQACGALKEAHDAGLVHRDIKPANIVLTSRGGVRDVVKILDFGLVKLVEPDPALGVSHEGVITGTPLYLSPEALTDPDAIDGRADLYAIGATAYFLLTGVPVFEGKTLIDLCSKQLHDSPIAPSTRLGSAVPPRFERIVLACLAKKPDDRPRDAATLLALLADGDSGDWSAEAAERWWTERGAHIDLRAREKRRSRAGESSLLESVAVDLGYRTTLAVPSGGVSPERSLAIARGRG
jgi:serine/threonine-protein kinase